jgi:phage terminase small subunit
MSIDWSKVRAEYETTGIQLKELADKYGVKYPTVKSRKQRQGWQKQDASPIIKDASSSKQDAPSKKRKGRSPKKEKVEGKEPVETSDLNERQQLFCIYYAKYFNAVKAAMKAGYSRNYSYSRSYELLENVGIKSQITRLKASKFKGAMLEKEDLLQKYIDIAFADITDFVDFGQEEVQVMSMYGPIYVEDKNTGEKIPLKKIVNTVRFKNSAYVDGTIISEVSQGKDGAKIKLQDKMKALDFLSRHSGLLI